MKQKSINDTNAVKEVLKKIEQLYKPCPDPRQVGEDECLNCEQLLLEAVKLAGQHSLTEKQADVLLSLCNCAFNHSDIPKAWEHVNRVFALIKVFPDYPNLKKAYNLRGRLYWMQSDFSNAIEDYKKALPLFRADGKELDAAGMCMNLSGLYSKLGKPTEALQWIEEATAGFEAHGDQKTMHLATSTKGNILLAMGHLEEAFAIKKQCEDYFASVQDLRQQSVELNALSVISNQMNRNDLAIEYSHRAIALKEKMNDFAGLAPALVNLGVFYSESGDTGSAVVYYKKALERYQQIGSNSGICTCLNNLGNICFSKQDYELAREYFEQALPMVLESQSVESISVIKSNLGLIYCITKSNPEEGLKLQQEACKISLESGKLYDYVSYRTHLASSLNKYNRPKEALDILEDTLKIAQENNYEKQFGDIYKQIDLAFAGLGNHSSAREYLLKFCQYAEDGFNRDLMDKITEMKTKYETEKKEREAEIYRLKNTELLEKNRLIEEQKNKLQETLDKLYQSEIRYDFVSQELTRSIGTTLIGSSQTIHSITQMIAMVAKSDRTNVLITGETGTGKEIVARNIHLCSKRGKQHFYAVNCSAVPENLFESQFFGHEKDAFTGATSTKVGWFEIANNSTLFLDEIGSLSFDQQAKLLRALEEHYIVRVGSHREIPIDLRIISATNVNLLNKVEKEEFRRDLYHRLAIFVINIPPLRQRREDIPFLLKHFVGMASQALNKKIKKLDKDVIGYLAEYNFPGNVRELKNMVERAVLVADSSTLRRVHFLIPCDGQDADSHTGIVPLDTLERDMILKALQSADYNRVQAAKLLGVNRKVVERKIIKHNIIMPTR